MEHGEEKGVMVGENEVKEGERRVSQERAAERESANVTATFVVIVVAVRVKAGFK